MSGNFVSLPLVIHAQSDCANQLVERFLDDALKTIETRFKDDLERLHPEPRHYAARYPEVVSALINAHATAFQTLAISEALRELRDVVDKRSEELGRIDASLDGIAIAIKMLDRS